MKVKEFVEKYNKVTSDALQTALIKELNVKMYIPYLEKVNMCEKVVNATYYKTDATTGKRELHVNSPANYLMYCLSIVDMYTDIEVDYTNNLEEFDLLNKDGFIDIIMAVIPEREMKEFRMILEMVGNDVVRNEYEIHSFIHNEVTRFGELIGTVVVPALEGLNKFLDGVDEKTIDQMVKRLQKVIK